MPIDGPEAVLRHTSSAATPTIESPWTPGRPSARASRGSPTAAPASTWTCCSLSGHGRLSSSYINNTVIPMLCRKAGVPAADLRGNITSHRARSTIASLPRKRVLLTD